VPVDERRPPYRFAYRTRVGFDETDAQGIVYYGRYMPYFDRARVEYLRNLEVLVREPSDPEFVMRSQHVEYHAPARFDDPIEIDIRIARIGRTSLTYELAAYLEGDVAAVTATQTLVLVDLAERRPLEIPPWFRERVVAFEGADVEA
jgi:acyl-CoA thioester hydrolase